MLMSGLITGADTGVVYIRGEYPLAVRKLREAVVQLEMAGITESGPGKASFPFRFHVVEGSGAYICGEETSLLNSLEGLRPEIRTRPPFPAVYGLFGKPTVLSNVETFANIHYILLTCLSITRRPDLYMKRESGTSPASQTRQLKLLQCRAGICHVVAGQRIINI